MSSVVPPLPRPRMTIEQRRATLASAAVTVMKREGIPGATTRAICAEAGMPHGAFHYCFHSKRDLYAAILAIDRDIDLEHVWTQINPHDTPRENVRRLLEAYWAEITADPAEKQLLFELSSFLRHDPHLRELPRLAHAAALATIGELAERFAAAAAVTFEMEVAEAARLLSSTLDGITWLIDRDDLAARASLAHYADLLAASVTPRLPAPGEEAIS